MNKLKHIEENVYKDCKGNIIIKGYDVVFDGSCPRYVINIECHNCDKGCRLHSCGGKSMSISDEKKFIEIRNKYKD